MSRITPLLCYDDPAAAIGWLCRAFGFEEHCIVRDPAGAVRHAELRMGDELVMLSPVREVMAGARNDASRHCVCVAVEDVDAHYARALAEGATVVAPLEDAPWGARLYVCRDLEGHVWSFGDYWGQPISSASASPAR